MRRTGVQHRALACDVCGRMPHPRRVRLTMAKLGAVFPVELALHALVIHYHPPYLLTVLLLTISTTLLVIWVVEPSAMRVLGNWLHGPELHTRDRITRASALWRIRAHLADRPGQLQALARSLAQRGVNILSVHVHHLESGVLDELVVATPIELTADALGAAVRHAGGSAVRVWPASSLTLIDGQTKALAIAGRVVADPMELPLAVAELLAAEYLAPGMPVPPAHPLDGTTLHLMLEDERPLTFVRPDEPFTPAEIARARRLSDLALLAARYT